jgi:hypothetical protein
MKEEIPGEQIPTSKNYFEILENNSDIGDIKRAGREGGTPGNLRRATGTISGDETPEYQ